MRRNRVFTIVNPIDETVFNGSRSRTPVQGRVLYAGRIHPAKGLTCLAEACKRLFEKGDCTELVLVGVCDKTKGGGGDEFVAELRNVAAPCPVKADGPITDAQKLAEIERTADVFVYPSEDALGEACPIAPMEAMALGVPTIVSRMRCYDDYVKEGRNALKFRASDVDDLEATLRALVCDIEMAFEVSKNGVEDLKGYSVGLVANRYLSIFDRIIDKEEECDR